jgi:hypothetical protein
LDEIATKLMNPQVSEEEEKEDQKPTDLPEA